MSDFSEKKKPGFFALAGKSALRLTIQIPVTIVMLALFALGAIAGFKSCSYAVWTGPEEPQAYRIQGSDGRVLAVVFMPDNKVLHGYLRSEQRSVEFVLCEAEGEDADHLVGPLWVVGDFPLGLRWYSEASEVWRLNMVVVRKLRVGEGDSVFPEEGESAEVTMRFKPDRSALFYSNMWLDSVDLSEVDLQQIVDYFEDPEK